MSEDALRKNIIEPFDPDKHDRAAFSCGVEQVDNFFRKTANKLAKADNARVYVMAAPDGTVIGFYSLNAHAVDYQDLPKKYARTRPVHGSIPAAFLSMIGVDRRYAGQGFGGDLLVDALLRVAQAAEQIEIAVVILERFPRKRDRFRDKNSLQNQYLEHILVAKSEPDFAGYARDMLDDGNPELVERRTKLYAGYGFQPLPSNPLRMFLPVATVRELLADDEGS
ncbi:GNAT family N-acetyltransferase [Stappia sediminis]|uniref:GNAT family N-acetyltransferase n=1 Tax=Stappia sediminis TaxID=2692190 RepID=UPI001AD8B251|nr:GNAT family N-acetyltransferase [Stappia sediminis]